MKGLNIIADKFDDNSGNYTQTVLVNDKTVSTLSTSDGKAQGWGSSVECAEDNCGTVGAHCKSTIIHRYSTCGMANASVLLYSVDRHQDYFGYRRP